MFVIINTAAILVTLLTIYWFWVRKILAETPAFKAIIDQDNTFMEALQVKFAGIKQKFAGMLIITASTAVTMYDTIIPAMTGVDITPLTAKIPQWTFPLIAIGITALLNYFRHLSDKRSEELVVAPPAPPQAG